jgi:hypothetical protein
MEVQPTVAERCAEVVFVVTVTSYLLWRVVGEAAGAGSAIEIAVYGLTAAFGLEFLISSWGALWTDPAGEG